MKSKLTNGIIMALAILGGLFIFLTVFIAVTDNNDTAPQTVSVRDDIEIKQDYTPTKNTSDYIGIAFEEAFMDGCTGEGASRGACQCMFDYIDENMTNDELMAFSAMPNIEEHPMFNKAVSLCYDK